MTGQVGGQPKLFSGIGGAVLAPYVDYTTGSLLTAGAASTASGVIDADADRACLVSCAAAIYLKVAATPTAAAAAGNRVIPPGEWIVIVPKNQKIAVLRVGGSDVPVSVIPLAT